MSETLCNDPVHALTRQVDQATGELYTREEVIAICTLPLGHSGYHRYTQMKAHEAQAQKSPPTQDNGSVG